MQFETRRATSGASLDELRDLGRHPFPLGAAGSQYANSALDAGVSRVFIVCFENHHLILGDCTGNAAHRREGLKRLEEEPKAVLGM